MRSAITAALLALAMAGTAAAQPSATSPSASPPDATSPAAAPPDATSPTAAPPSATSPADASPDATSPAAVPPDATSPAAAPPSATSPAVALPSATSPTVPAQQPGEELNEGTAVWLSLGGTLASWTLLGVSRTMDHQSSNAGGIAEIGALGTLLAPSFGHWYAHSYITRGLGLRLAGVLSGFLGIVSAFSCEGECTTSYGTHLAGGLLLVGAGLYIGGTIDDIVTAPGEARRYNQRFQNVTIAPMVGRDNRGLMLTGRF